MKNEARKKALEAAIRESIEVVAIEVRDDSGLHEGHNSAGNKGHYAVKVVSDSFIGKTRIARHRQIYQAVTNLLATDVHALAITAQTSQEASYE